jgi:hypothetical protein
MPGRHDPERRAVCKVEHKICALCVIERELLQDNTGVVSYPDQSGPRCRRVFDAVMAFFRSSGPAADPSTARMPHILSLLSQGFWRGFVRGDDESMIQEVAKFAKGRVSSFNSPQGHCIVRSQVRRQPRLSMVVAVSPPAL